MDEGAVRAGQTARIIAVCLSESKGVAKTPVERAVLVEGHGIAGDAHAGPWHRQVSLLSTSSIAKVKAMGLDVSEGMFAENLTVDGIDVYLLPIGTKLKAGSDVVLEVTQIGKECHSGCSVFETIGMCIMPKEGIFTRVLRGGRLSPGDELVVLPSSAADATLAEAGQTA